MPKTKNEMKNGGSGKGSGKNVIKVVVDGFTMKVIRPNGSTSTIQGDKPHSAYATVRRDVKDELSAFIVTSTALGNKPKRVLELFGGSGWHSSIIQRRNKPKGHVVFELDRDCADSIRLSLPGLDVRQVDSYKEVRRVQDGKYDWIHADFNQFTLNRYRREKGYKDIVANMFEKAGRFVTLTDSAVYGLSRFERNLGSYSDFFGYKLKNWTDYFEAAARFYLEKFQFSTRLVTVWGRNNASMFLFTKNKTPKSKLPPFRVLKVFDGEMEKIR